MAGDLHASPSFLVPIGRKTRWGIRLATLAAVGIGLFLAGRGVSIGRLVHVLRSIEISSLAALAVACLAVGFVLRAGRFRAVLGGSPVPFRHTVATMVLSQAANNVLPLRAGELVKTRDFVAGGHPVGRVIAAQGAEKLIEAALLVLLCIPTLAIEFGWSARVVALAGLLVATLVPLVWLAPRFGVRAEQVRRAFVWALAADVVEIALVSVTLRSLGLTSGLTTSIIVLGAVNLSIALPSGPSHLGAFEAGAALGLVAMGVSRDFALAFALLYRVVQWVPVMLAGTVVWAWRALARRACPPLAAAAIPSALQTLSSTLADSPSAPLTQDRGPSRPRERSPRA